MATKVKRSDRWADIHKARADLYLFENGRVDIGVKHPGMPEDCAVVDRADFLAAVASELNVIVIDRSELPEVTTQSNGIFTTVKAGDWVWGSDDGSDVPRRTDALAILAALEHLAANPPIDEAQVSALRDVVESVAQVDWKFSGHEQQDTFLARDIARALIATGKVTVTTGGAS